MCLLKRAYNADKFLHLSVYLQKEISVVVFFICWITALCVLSLFSFKLQLRTQKIPLCFYFYILLALIWDNCQCDVACLNRQDVLNSEKEQTILGFFSVPHSNFVSLYG